jgi:hypothetical protein
MVDSSSQNPPQGYQKGCTAPSQQGCKLQQAYPPIQGGDQKGEEQHSKNQVTPSKPVFQDLWAAVLYYLHLAVFLGLGVFCILAATNRMSSGGNKDIGVNVAPSDDIIGFVVAMTATVSLIFTGSYLFLMYKYPKELIYVTFLVSIGMTGAMGVWYLYVTEITGAVMMFLFTGLYALLFFMWRSRIPFAALVLESVVAVLKKYPAMLNVVAVNLVVGILYAVFWFVSVMGASTQFSGGTLKIVTFYFAFSLFWSMQVFANTAHVTLSGVFATYYFLEGTGQAVRNPTAAAFRRALSYSFGSVCFGSLLVALLQLIRLILRCSVRRGTLAAACVDCLLSFVEELIEYFNRYAFTQVAMYGKDFRSAAKETWSLMKSHGVDAVANDFFLGKVMGLGVLFGMILGGVTAGLTFSAVATSTISEDSYIYLFIMGGMLIGALFMSLMVTVVDSGIVTILVCVASDPNALARSKPALYNKFREVYPQVTWF